ncbi:unnamed protein product [Durusdinium trenchii]|uniref:ABC-2 type transporter transmembrane domain-containing protein n=1 Tax=Durusdinium trenchii TaxID=1381693 RepID=A0ABP0HPN3_9DINO
MPDHTMPADFVMRLCIDPRDPEGAANRRVAISDAWDKQWPNDALIDRATDLTKRCSAQKYPPHFNMALADMPFDILIALIWSATMFWMVGFRDDFEHFFYFFLGVYALTCVATGIGYLGGYAAPVAAIGMLVVLLNIMPQMLFGGLFMNLDAVPPGFVWLKTISVFRLGFEALMINQWQDYGELPCANGTIAIPCVAANGEQVLRTNGVDPAGSYAETLIWLLIPWCIYHLLAFVLLWRRARPRQFEGAAPEDDTKGELRRQSEAEAPKLNIRRPKIALQWENLSMEADNKSLGRTGEQWREQQRLSSFKFLQAISHQLEVVTSKRVNLETFKCHSDLAPIMQPLTPSHGRPEVLNDQIYLDGLYYNVIEWSNCQGCLILTMDQSPSDMVASAGVWPLPRNF